MSQNPYKVKISSGEDKIILSVSPSSFSESRSANFDPWSLTHLPTDLYAYRNTTSRNWELTGMLVSRNEKESRANSKILHLVRSWLLPDFAVTGAPPPILKLSAYGDPNINEVTCILRSYSWNYPSDTDYVLGPIHKMPIIGSIGISLLEIYSANEIQKQKWKIKMSNEEPIPKSPIPDLPNYPEFPDLSTPDFLKSPLIPEITGDLNNFFNNSSIPSFTNIVKDVSSNLPSLPSPSDVISPNFGFK